MAKRPYDPQKRREYYLRTRELKGRKAGVKAATAPRRTSSKTITKKAPAKSNAQSSKAKVTRLKAKVDKLQGALTEAQNALSEKRRNEAKERRKNSDGKTTAKERQSAKEYRERNRSELRKKEAERRESNKSSSGSSSSRTSSSPKTVESMGVEELERRVTKIRSTLAEARKQLVKATSSVSKMKDIRHSAQSASGSLYDPPTSRKESVHMEPDFGGYATRNNVRCSDGRTILADAFKHNDGQIVPLVWEHGHKDPLNVLGYAKLENRSDGVYAHAYFNSTAQGKHAKEMVKHGDVRFLSIFANGLREKVRDATQNLKDVIHGNIREVSLVLAGANEGATIDHVNIVHSDGSYDVDFSEAIIRMDQEIDLAHAETAKADKDADETVEDVINTMSEKQKNVLYFIVGEALSSLKERGENDDDDKSAEHSSLALDTMQEFDGETVEDIIHSMTDKQKDALYFIVGEALSSEDHIQHSESNEDDEAEVDEEDESDNNEPEDSPDESEEGDEAGGEVQHGNTNSQEDNSMTHNVFDQAKHSSGGANMKATLSHSDIQTIVEDAKENGSLKRSIEKFVKNNGVTVNGTLQHGVENIEYLFPDAKTLENSPQFISRRMEWVDKVLSGVRKSPFARIKTITADITPDEARARGYIKGNMKNEEFFALSKRETTPQTIYKKQKLDRDDVIDIVDLDVVAWLKAEMKVMLDEELAGAILIGDGRSVGDEDKIREDKIRPIASDAELYVTTAWVNLDDADSSVEELVDAAIAHRRYYKGTGQPTFYTTESTISAFLTVKDNFGRRIYQDLAAVAAVLRVREVIPVEIMERVPDLVGIMVNLADYTLGADRGGQATMFDDFDIDYNKLRYLIETRCSGALTLPKSAIVFRKTEASSQEVQPLTPTFDGTTVTVPTVAGVIYRNAEDDSVLTTDEPVTLEVGETLMVVAVPAAGRHFANNANDEWEFTNEG